MFCHWPIHLFVQSHQASLYNMRKGIASTCTYQRKQQLKLTVKRFHMASFTMFFVFLQGFHCSVNAGSSPSLYVTIIDPMKKYVIQPRNIFEFTKEPSSQPSSEPSFTSQPSVSPTSSPSQSQYPSVLPTVLPTSNQPSSLPSSLPTILPTAAPSNQPSYSPSASMSPSAPPTNTEFPTEVPSGIPSMKPKKDMSYFNYNPFDENYGPGQPSLESYIYNETSIGNSLTMSNTKTTNYTRYSGNAWESVRNSFEYKYWAEFDMNRTLGNRCASDPRRSQSPIDLCPDVVNAECFEHHQARNRVSNLIIGLILIDLSISCTHLNSVISKGGEYNLDDTEVTLKILPSKLRIEYSRENSELDPSKLRPPHGDFAHNWNGYISAVHIDVKSPSEHTICGKRYAGEYQIYFYHPNRKQPIVQSVLIEIEPNERHHKHFQKVLNEWQALYDERAMECMDQDREERKLEETFLRRMENFMATSLDSHEISPRDLGERGESKWSSNSDQSTILDEPRDDSAQFQNILRQVKYRASHPLFEEQYEGLNLSAIAANNVVAKKKLKPSYLRRRAADTIVDIKRGVAQSTESRVDDCQDFRESFLLEGANITCEDIQPSNSTYSHCKSTGIVKRLCPVACGVCQHSSTIINGTVSDSSPPSASPTSPPTSRGESTDSSPPSASPASPPTSKSNSPSSSTRTNPPKSRVKWDPFQPRIVNSIYFYGYGGSLTEPPCSEWVSWRILDTPMQISSAQLNQMNNILFGHLDQDCKRNIVQWQHSVARPTQSLNDRELWQCTRDDYESDAEKNENPSNDN